MKITIKRIIRTKHRMGARKYVFETFGLNNLSEELETILQSVVIGLELHRRFYLTYKFDENTIKIILLPTGNKGEKQLFVVRNGYRFFDLTESIGEETLLLKVARFFFS